MMPSLKTKIPQESRTSDPESRTTPAVRLMDSGRDKRLIRRKTYTSENCTRQSKTLMPEERFVEMDIELTRSHGK